MCKFCERAKAQGSEDPFDAIWFGDDEDINRNRSREALQRSAKAGPAWEPTTAADRAAAESCSSLRARRLPVLVLTGFLGAGKTTLLNRLLATTSLRLGVIENEVGSVSIDDQLVRDSTSLQKGAEGAQEVVLMPNGCMCCRVRGDLRDAFEKIVRAAHADPLQPAAASTAASTATFSAPRPQRRLDGLILELSGLSELGPVVETFFADPFVQSALGLDSIVCVCDAGNLRRQLQSDSALIREQLALADLAILNKTDTLAGQKTKNGKGSDELAGLARAVAAINSTCTVFPCSLGGGGALPSDFFGMDAFMQCQKFTKGVQLAAAAIPAQPYQQPPPTAPVSGHGHGHGHPPAELGAPHHHDALGYRSFSIEISDRLIDPRRLARSIEVLHERAKEGVATAAGIPVTDALTPIVRCKGIVFGSPTSRTALQGLYEHVDLIPLMAAAAGSAATILNQIVFIGPIGAELQLAIELQIAALATALPPTRGTTMSASVRVAPSPQVRHQPAAPARQKGSGFANLKNRLGTLGGLRGGGGTDDFGAF